MTDFGTDFSTFWRADGIADLDPTFTLIAEERVVAESIARRLMTPRGGMLRDPNYGFDVRNYSSIKLTSSRKIELKSGIREQCLAEERVIAANVSIVQDPASSLMTISIDLEMSDGSDLELVLAVDKLKVEILDGTA